MTEPLPSFERPPVTEVVVGVAFRDAPGLTVGHLGDLWGRKWKERFPRVEEHPPYIPPIERFDGAAGGPTVTVQLLAKPSARLWFVAGDGHELIQAQNEWFACNWRKVGDDSEYDRWPKRRHAFEEHFGDLDTAVREDELGSIAITQCEVSYINHIRAADDGQRQRQLSRVLRFLSPIEAMAAPEQTQLGVTFVMPAPDGKPIGRLHVTAQPAVLREDRTPIFVLTLLARGRPQGEGLEGALRFLDQGREWIVKTFESITTDEMHAEWGPNA